MELTQLNDRLQKEIETVQQITIIPKMLEVICRTTGMGFAAVARVTETHWIACSVRDEIAFGLQPGGELQIETTICNEIRDCGQPVLIDHVDMDERYRDHHTPRIYGFQSYISVPIVLNTGDFFGTLCAIDPHPTKTSDPKIISMFNLFAQLIAQHLQALDLIEQASSNLTSTSEQLELVQEENRQYEHLTYHSLREPLRKIMLFTDLLLYEVDASDTHKAKETARKVHSFSQILYSRIRSLKD